MGAGIFFLIWYTVGLVSSAWVLYNFEHKRGHDIHLSQMIWCIVIGVGGPVTLFVAAFIYILMLDWSWTKKIVIKGKTHKPRVLNDDR